MLSIRMLAAGTLCVAGLATAGCGTADDAPTHGAVEVVATTTILGDLARSVGGADADVHQLLQPNSDPHDYEPRPDDAIATAEADVVLASGAGLDAWIGQVAEQADGDARLVEVGEHVPIVRADGEHAHGEEGHADDADEDAHAGHDHGDVDPHWWHDPRNVEAAVVTIRDALAQANPGARATYARNAAAYLRRLRALDAGVRACVATIPAARRKLVTDHDAFGYFADRYGLEVVGTVIPSLTTQAQASAGDLAELTRTIEREGVTTIFSAQSVNPKLAEAVARETSTRIDDSLYGDALGPEGSDGATYLSMEAHNADRIMRGLSGGRRGCPAVLAGLSG
jgi:zinc/manganese transport system substrate-binding protein